MIDQALDKRKRGEVPFQDFADWVIGKQLEQEPCTAEDELDAADEADAQMGGGAGRSMKSGRPMKSSKVSSFRRGRTGAIDWGLIAERLPYGRSQVEKDRRKELFNLIDVNGNGCVLLLLMSSTCHKAHSATRNAGRPGLNSAIK